MYKTTKGDKVSAILGELESGLKNIYGGKLKKIVLYGSYATEQYQPGSDLDLMVLLDLAETDFYLYDDAVLDLTIELTTRYGIYISVIKNNIDFFDEWNETLPFFKNVVKEGVLVYGT